MSGVKLKSVKYNLVMNVLRLLMNMIFPLISYPYAAKILAPEGIGKVSFAQSFVSYFMLIAMLGIPTYGIRACAKVRDSKESLSKTVKEILIINTISLGLVLLVFLISITQIGRLASDPKLYLVVGISIVLNSCGMEWVFQALEQYRYITIRSFIFKVLGMLSLFLFVKSESDYIQYALVTVIASYGSNLLNLFYSRKYIDFTVKINIRDSLKHLKPILMFFSITAAASVYMNLDTLMLGVMTNDTQVGLYTTATKMKTIVLSMVTALGTVMLPRISYFYANGMMDEFNKAINKGLNFVKIVAVPLALFFVINTNSTILLISSEAYLDAKYAMQLIMPVVIFSGFSSLIGMQVFVAYGKEKIVMLSACIGAIVNVSLNALVIPQFYAAGAAFATSVSELVVLLIELYFGKKLLTRGVIKISFLKVAFASVLAGVVSIFTIDICAQLPFWNFLYNAVSFFGVYFLALILMRETLLTDYTQMILRMIKRKYTKSL